MYFMKYKIDKTDTTPIGKLRTEFLIQLGLKIRKYREKKNLAQVDLAKCLGISDSSLSDYENGVEDMKISHLPVISLYCDVPMERLLPSEEMREFISSVSMAVDITRKRYERQDKTKSGSKRKLISRTFEEGGMEYTVPAFEDISPPSIREQYRRGIIEPDAQPLSEKEFYNYVKDNKPELIGVILDAGMLLRDLEDMPKTETIKGYVADFIVNKVFMIEYSDRNNRYNTPQQRLYAYYYVLLEHSRITTNFNPIKQ